jgi:ABC-type polar amino acid transport system ATPase subunit
VESSLASFTARSFRSARDVTLEPGRLCALVGEANAGKSTVLVAIRALLDPGAPPLRFSDVTAGDGRIELEGVLRDGHRVTLDDRSAAPPVLFFPARLRQGGLIAGPIHRAAEARLAVKLITRALSGATAPRRALIRGLEACRGQVRGLVLLMEEPELFLRPQAQRYLYRLLDGLSEDGNQIVYSTHSPSFLNVARLEQLAFVSRHPEQGTRVLQPRRVTTDEDFRVLSEFDAERSELFLARAAILVEGLTEKLTFPFVFAALGHDADRETISIVECGGKSNIPLFARICKATGIPFVAVHDRDADAGQAPIDAEAKLNARIARECGRRRTVVLTPDFEGVAGLRGSARKPERAWRRFGRLGPDEVPEPLARAVHIALELARE